MVNLLSIWLQHRWSHLFLKFKLWLRVTISLTDHVHIIPFFDWPLIHQFEKHVFRRIWLEKRTGWWFSGERGGFMLFYASWVCACMCDSQSNERLNVSELSSLICLLGMLYSTVQWKTDLASAFSGRMNSVLVTVNRPEASLTTLGIMYVSERQREEGKVRSSFELVQTEGVLSSWDLLFFFSIYLIIKLLRK